MKRFFMVGALATVAFAFATFPADNFWVEKNWKQWTAAECRKMLEDSPWARRVLVENANNASHLPSASRDASSTDTVQGAQNSGVGEINYFFQILSAEPIRHAYMREQELEAASSGMNATQKKAFDTKMEELVKTTPPDVIALHVIYKANRDGLSVMLVQAWQSLPAGSVPKDFILITDKGVHVLPNSFSITQGTDYEFDITFPRFLNGEPIFGAGAKSIKVQFVNPAMGDFGTEKKTFEFKLDKMIVDGKPAY